MTAILASAMLLGILVPTIVNNVEMLYWRHSSDFGLDFEWVKGLFASVRYFIPPLILFYGFAMFYKFAPQRKTTLQSARWIQRKFRPTSLFFLSIKNRMRSRSECG